MTSNTRTVPSSYRPTALWPDTTIPSIPQGCAFGCQYCYADAFIKKDAAPLGKADWGKWVRVKQNAVAMVRDAAAAGTLDGKSVYMSTATDPYRPTERKTGQTRQILTAMARARNLGLVIQTRGPLADNDEDIDLCREICRRGGHVQVQHDHHHQRRRHPQGV